MHLTYKVTAVSSISMFPGVCSTLSVWPKDVATVTQQGKSQHPSPWTEVPSRRHQKEREETS